MEEALISSSEIKKKPGEGNESVFKSRRIEFHPARKPFLGFISNPNFKLETLNPSCSDYTHAPTPLKSTPSKRQSDHLEHGLDPELCFGITVRRIGAGLENLGNTCFLNSVLQCLTYTEPFAAYLQSGKHKSSCHTAGFCAMCAIQNHVKQALQSTGRILAPKALVMNLRCISRNFRNARQEDAHEYMVNLLESMHKCCLPSGVPSESPSAYEKSLVHKIFGGRLRSQVKCMQCSYCSNTFDPFLDLSLEIMRADSLDKALSHFTAVEQLDGGARQYQCQRCKQKVRALKQLTIHKAPYVLSIHLKRFRSDYTEQKIGKQVHFGSTLDLKPYVSGAYEGDLKYTLYGVLVHAGFSTHSGHYYCFVRTSSGMWHSLDDRRVGQVSEKFVMQQRAYMLFYVRDRRNIAPKKPINTIGPSFSDCRENCASEKTKAVQNGQTGSELFTSDVSKKPQLKESSVSKTAKGLQMENDTASPLINSRLQSSSMLLVNAHSRKESTNCPSVQEVDPQSTRSVQGSSYTLTVAVTESQKNPKGLPHGSVPVAVPPTCSGSQSSGSENLVQDKVIHVNDINTNKGIQSEEPLKEVNDLKHERSIPARPLKQSGVANNQSGGRFSHKHPSQNAQGSDLSLQKTRLDKSSAKSCKGSEHILSEAVSHHRNLQKKLKSKKKVLKKVIANMHFGSRFLMKASLSLHQKKKLKRSKHRNSQLKRHIQENEIGNSEGLEPSTSEKRGTPDPVSTDTNRRKRKSSPEKRGGHSAAKDVQTLKKEDLINVTEGELSKRIHRKNAALVRCESSRNCPGPTSEEKPQVPREPDTSPVKRDNTIKSIITLKLKGSAVPRWDEVESSPSQIPVSNGEQSISIGYVPDEWDEEYDRGKRKKVRSFKDSFDGSNPFQEIATEKTKLKKAKFTKISNRNQPMRIQ